MSAPMSNAPKSEGTNTASMTITTTVSGLFFTKDAIASIRAENMFIKRCEINCNLRKNTKKSPFRERYASSVDKKCYF